MGRSLASICLSHDPPTCWAFFACTHLQRGPHNVELFSAFPLARSCLVDFEKVNISDFASRACSVQSVSPSGGKNETTRRHHLLLPALFFLLFFLRVLTFYVERNRQKTKRKQAGRNERLFPPPSILPKSMDFC